MRKLVVLSVALIAVLLWSLPAEAAQAGPGGTGGGSVSPSSVPRSYVPPVVEEHGRVRVSLVGLLHTGKQDSGWRFSGQTLRDLVIVVEYRDLPAGPHTQRLKLFAPDGALYQQFTTEFAANDHSARGQSRRGAGWQPVETRLPVGGTWITQYSLYGTWRVEVYLDQARTPVVHRNLVLGW